MVPDKGSVELLRPTTAEGRQSTGVGEAMVRTVSPPSHPAKVVFVTEGSWHLG